MGMGVVHVFLLNKAYSSHASGLSNFKRPRIKNALKTTPCRSGAHKNAFPFTQPSLILLPHPQAQPIHTGEKTLKIETGGYGECICIALRE